MRITVALNGTNQNPFMRFNLTQNPFPQIATAEHAEACLRLQALGGEPIKNLKDLEERLAGFSQEFVELCMRKFEPGKYVRFDITWEE